MIDSAIDESHDHRPSGELLSVVYVSVATVPFSDEDLALLLATSRMHNQARELTGLLLHRRGQFMQALEGPPHEVRMTLTTIASDPRHTGVWTLHQALTHRRRFASWAMGYLSLSEEEAETAPTWFGSEDPHRPVDESRAGELLAWFRNR